MVRLPRKQVDRPALTITLPEGNPGRGYALGQKLDCVRCHLNSPGDAPRYGADGELPAILARAEMRLADPAYSGSATTPEEYLIESITDPRLYEVDGNWKSSMNDQYYDLPEQDLADLIAWVLSVEE
jgi:nitric oxide reductase subunit C